jgi:hypothetical protein
MSKNNELRAYIPRKMLDGHFVLNLGLGMLDKLTTGINLKDFLTTGPFPKA